MELEYLLIGIYEQRILLLLLLVITAKLSYCGLI